MIRVGVSEHRTPQIKFSVNCGVPETDLRYKTKEPCRKTYRRTNITADLEFSKTSENFTKLAQICLEHKKFHNHARLAASSVVTYIENGQDSKSN